MRNAKPTNPRIALVNVASDNNRGACALTWASIEFVLEAFPDASIAIIPVAETPHRADAFRHTTKRYPGLEILPSLFVGGGRTVLPLLALLARSLQKVFTFDRRRSNPDPTLEWLRNCDLVVSVGGVTFETRPGTFRDGARFLIRILPLLAAKRIDLDYVLVGAQAGPFDSLIGRRLFRHVASTAAAIFPRDLVSAAEVQRLPRTRQILLPDSAFSLELPQEVLSSLLAGRGIDTTAPILAIAISSALRPDESREEHVSLFADVANTLRASGLVKEIVIVLQADEDRAISLELVQSLRLDARFFVDDDLSPSELSSLYGCCRMVVASRLHAVILALLAGVPAISMAPEVTFKERAVLEMLGLESLCVPTRLGSDRAGGTCLKVAAAETQYRQSIAGAVSAARAALQEVPSVIRQTARKTAANESESRREMDRSPSRRWTPLPP